jgi:magnesium-protoporphyrin O-methyltransferase
MPDCCGPGSARYEEVFDRRFADALARRYRRHGLSAVERRIVDRLAATGITGATVLEVGGGIGEIQLELLRRGAHATTNLELSREYEPAARQLLAEAGMTGRATRIVGVDLATAGDRIDAADYVVLHRVVCCYPDGVLLVAAAASHARRAVVYSHPPRNWLTRTAVWASNAWMRIRGRAYRGYVHTPADLYRAAREAGFSVATLRRGPAWTVAEATRS